MIGKAKVLVTTALPFITRPISFFRRIWPVAGLTAAVIVNAAWMGFLGYGLFTLVETSFF
jgi:hypothetical protein